MIYGLLLFSLNASAQLKKQIFEKEFPTIKLPYDTKGMLFGSYNPTEPFNHAKAKFVKGEITTLLKKYINTNLIINEQGKKYAIGRFNFANKNYVVYLEASVDLKLVLTNFSFFRLMIITSPSTLSL